MSEACAIFVFLYLGGDVEVLAVQDLRVSCSLLEIFLEYSVLSNI